MQPNFRGGWVEAFSHFIPCVPIRKGRDIKSAGWAQLGIVSAMIIMPEQLWGGRVFVGVGGSTTCLRQSTLAVN